MRFESRQYWLRIPKAVSVKRASPVSRRPIGIFDSGLGGISVLREIRAHMPAEALCYVADSHYAPYGEKSVPLIRQRSEHCCERLIEQNVKAIVVACNTATAAAVSVLRARYALPIIAMEPAVKPAALISSSGKIGVLATAGTLSSEKYEKLLSQHASHVEVMSQPCFGLVEEIEKGDFESPALRNLLWRYIEPLLRAQVDTLILGCTHYPLITPLIKALVGDGVTVLDSGQAVAKRLHQQLQALQLLSSEAQQLPLRCWSSGDLLQQQSRIRALWPHPFELSEL